MINFFEGSFHSLHILCPTKSKSLRQGSSSSLGYRQAKVGQEHMPNTVSLSPLSGHSASSQSASFFVPASACLTNCFGSHRAPSASFEKTLTCPLLHVNPQWGPCHMPVSGSFHFTTGPDFLYFLMHWLPIPEMSFTEPSHCGNHLTRPTQSVNKVCAVLSPGSVLGFCWFGLLSDAFW